MSLRSSLILCPLFLSAIIHNYSIGQNTLPDNVQDLIAEIAGMDIDAESNQEMYASLIETYQNPIKLIFPSLKVR